MNLSNYRNLKIYRADITNIPYVFTFSILCNDTELFVVNRRENVTSGAWECHYVQHASSYCERCASVGNRNVELYSDCPEFTELFQRNYSDVLAFLREYK